MMSLAVGITTAMFTVVDALLFNPVPFKDPDRLAVIGMRDEHGGPTTVSAAVFRVWRSTGVFEGIEAAMSSHALIETDSGDVIRHSARVTPGIFKLLGGVEPIRGRLFSTSSEEGDSSAQVLLSEDVWRTSYSSDAGIVGRRITLDGQSVVVIGILPSDFRFPAWDTVIWRSAMFGGSAGGAEQERPVVYARFASTVPRRDALAVATAAAVDAGLEPARTWAFSSPLVAREVDSYYRRAMPLLSGFVVLLFVVLCANTSSILLVDIGRRQREFAIRAALGATRSRLVIHAFLEAATIGAAAVLAGIAIAWALVSIARVYLPEAFLLRSLNPLNLDARALWASSISALCATVGAGLLPALLGTRIDANRALELTSRGVTETPHSRLAGRVLLVFQVALSCALLLGATALVRSFLTMSQLDRGVDAAHVIVAKVVLSPALLNSRASRLAAAGELKNRILELPGVLAVSTSLGAPPIGGMTLTGDWQSDMPGALPVHMMAHRFDVDSSFFELYRIPIVRGRPLQSSDPPNVVLVSERLAQALWPQVDPVGRTLKVGSEQVIVAGITKELRFPSLDKALEAPQIYKGFNGAPVMQVGVRCGTKCPDMVLLSKQLGAAQAGVALKSVGPLDETYSAQLARPRGAAALAVAFVIIALIACAAGLFALLSQSVAKRRREFGIRVALGASPGSMRRLLLRDALIVTIAGTAIGTAGGYWLTGAMRSLLFDSGMTDGMSGVVVLGVVAAIFASASWHPTRVAARTAPLSLITEEF